MVHDARPTGGTVAGKGVAVLTMGVFMLSVRMLVSVCVW